MGNVCTGERDGKEYTNPSKETTTISPCGNRSITSDHSFTSTMQGDNPGWSASQIQVVQHQQAEFGSFMDASANCHSITVDNDTIFMEGITHVSKRR